MSQRILGVAIIALASLTFVLGRLTATQAAHRLAPGVPELPETTAPGVSGQPSKRMISDYRQMSGVQVTTLSHSSRLHSVRARGRVDNDESRTYRVIAGIDGRLSNVRNTPAGTIVQKGERLATFFNNEFVKAEQAYFFSLQTLERVRASNRTADIQQAEESVRSNEETLFALGMGEAQLHEIAKTRQAIRDIDIVSPVTGVVVARNLSPGQRLERGAEMYRILDLSTVWIFVSVLPGEISALKSGTKARVIVRPTGTALEATMTPAVALFDVEHPFLQMKLEAPNPGLILRPDMYVDVEFEIPAPAGISVPKDAVIDKGLEKIVYVQKSDNVFEPRVVQLGSAFDDRVSIQRGLSEGDRVVVSGNFLMDSESRIRGETMRAAVSGPR